MNLLSSLPGNATMGRSIKQAFVFGFLVLVCCQASFSQDYFDQSGNQHENHLIIVHPTRSNLDRYLFLIKNGIIDPGENQLVGLYFESEQTDYSSIVEDYPEFGFHCVPEGLEIEAVFSKNTVSDEFRKIFNFSKGIIFNGGPDIPPATYGEKKLNLTQVSDPWRHYYELSFLFHLLGGSQNPDFIPFLRDRSDYMVLGICLGMQSMNVATGGTMIQDIPSEVYGKYSAEDVLELDSDQIHRNYYSDFGIYDEIRSFHLHPIKFSADHWLDLKFGETFETPYVVSAHHQAVETLGKGLCVMATSIDGLVVEAIEHVEFPNVMGFQFHPEVDFIYDSKSMYKFTPKDELFSMAERMHDLGSDEFHLCLWNQLFALFLDK